MLNGSFTCDMLLLCFKNELSSRKRCVIIYEMGYQLEKIVAGGCKHAVAFVAWLERRSQDVSPTPQKCYWAKSALAHVKDGEVFRATDLKPQASIDIPEGKVDAFFKEATEIWSQENFVLTKHLALKTSYSIFHLMMEYKISIPKDQHNAQSFIEFCSSKMTDEKCKSLARATKNQATSALWFDLRFGRITGSKVHEASKCRTPDGSFRNSVLGIVKVKETKAIKRGKQLEGKVINVVSKQTKFKRSKLGFVMKRIHPIIGASPDAIMGEYVIEVKCPETTKTFPSYFTKDFSKPFAKYLDQISLQMLTCNKKKGLFCVADPDFEINGMVIVIEVPLDEVYINNVIKEAMQYWSDHVYPYIYECT